jgi:hypothetical protein
VTIRQLVPREETVELEPLLRGMSGAAAHALAPFAAPVKEFCAAFSMALLRDPEARRLPELQALGFAMRKTELARLEQEFRRWESPDAVRVPRGVVFHIPPANVDTMFIYSWLVSVLMGNRNVIRIPASAGPAVRVLIRIFNSTQDGAEELRQNTCMVQYAHEREITSAISAAADVRIIWGGDETVRQIRSVPIPPHCTEITFPDRYSFAAIRAANYLELDEAGRLEVARQFYNDAFWFDQMACSSPRLVVWCGDPGAAWVGSERFYEALERCVAGRGYRLDMGARLNKFTFACRAILDEKVAAYETWGDEVTVLRLEDDVLPSRHHCGGGLIFQVQRRELRDIVPWIARKDQTLTYYGFDREELREFARAMNGRGVDRIVPMGQALMFQHAWDGYELFVELTRQISITA